MSIKVAKSIGLLYKLSRFLPEIILKTLYYSSILILWYIEAWHGTYQNNTSKIFILWKKAKLAIKFNLAYNEHTNAYFKSSNVTKYSNFLIGIS